MATYTLYGTNNAGAWDDVDKVKCIRTRVEGKNGYVTADVIKAIYIPAGTLVLNVMTKCVTPQTTTSTCTALTATVGDSGSANGWDASVDLFATAGTVLAGIAASETGRGLAAGYFYASADYIKLTLTLTGGGASTDFVFDVMAVCVQF